MKKKILSAVVAAAALFGAYTAQQANEVAMSDLQIENLEALAGGEPSGVNEKGRYISSYTYYSEYRHDWIRTWECYETSEKINECRLGEKIGELNINTGKLTVY